MISKFAGAHDAMEEHGKPCAGQEQNREEHPTDSIAYKAPCPDEEHNRRRGHHDATGDDKTNDS